MIEHSASDLNLLFDAALEFGLNWRRPLADLAAERLSGRGENYRRSISEAIEQCRSATEEHVAAAYQATQGDWTASTATHADAWVGQHFPWMTEDNRRHALSQSVYYAWHG